MEINIKRNMIIAGVLFVVLMFAYTQQNKANSAIKVNKKNGVYYKLSNNTPFTGKVLVRYESSPVNNEGNSRIGKVHFENEYSNGILVSKVHYDKVNDSKADC
ncbi:hypothetical protein [Psychrilyobacter atlanticus]|uniref:hypothetical protein n=1 Tax=Psychrilyobacter atlanticus TaxID=271091 RepID=UPI000407EA65|nr:hypothetical protein [Psychrilyobacter atlanticus]